jgi:hypothetical protein
VFTFKRIGFPLKNPFQISKRKREQTQMFKLKWITLEDKGGSQKTRVSNTHTFETESEREAFVDTIINDPTLTEMIFTPKRGEAYVSR